MVEGRDRSRPEHPVFTFVIQMSERIMATRYQSSMIKPQPAQMQNVGISASDSTGRAARSKRITSGELRARLARGFEWIEQSERSPGSSASQHARLTAVPSRKPRFQNTNAEN